MENGYRIFWTDHALNELEKTYEYLETNFTKRELRNLSSEIDTTLHLIADNPTIFPLSESLGVRKAVVKKIQHFIL